MPTFSEIQSTLNQTRFQKTILAHIVEHLDGDFLPILDQQPKKVLLTDEKVRVPSDAFEAVIVNLNNWLKACEQQEQSLLAANITIEPPKQEPTPQSAEAQQTTPTEEVKS